MKRTLIVLAAILIIALAFSQIVPLLLQKSDALTSPGSPNINPPFEEGLANDSAINSNDSSSFRSWFWDSGNTISGIVSEGRQAEQSLDLDAAKSSAVQLQETASEYLTQLSSFNLPSPFMGVRDEYKLALQDFKEAGHHAEEGITNLSMNDISAALSYLDSASNHMANATNMISSMSVSL